MYASSEYSSDTASIQELIWCQCYKKNTFIMLHSAKHEIYHALLINDVKIPTFVGILNLMYMINKTSESLKARFILFIYLFTCIYIMFLSFCILVIMSS